jgi:hypothetical protein
MAFALLATCSKRRRHVDCLKAGRDEKSGTYVHRSPKEGSEATAEQPAAPSPEVTETPVAAEPAGKPARQRRRCKSPEKKTDASWPEAPPRRPYRQPLLRSRHAGQIRKSALPSFARRMPEERKVHHRQTKNARRATAARASRKFCQTPLERRARQ